MTRSLGDRALIYGVHGAALIAGGVVIAILLTLTAESLPLIFKEGLGSFFFDEAWRPTEQLYNLTPMLWGSVLATMGAMFLATPLAILSALFCKYYAPPAVAGLYRRVIELLAGVPSVVYGLWGLLVLVPIIGSIRAPGTSLLAAILILTIMILPIITLTAHTAFTSVPLAYQHGASALGMSRWYTIRYIILPSSRSELFTAVILATGRAIGETMAVLMVAGNAVKTPGSIFDSARTLTANMALEMAYAMGDHRAALFVSGLLLTVMIIMLVVTAEHLRRPSAHG